MGRRGNEGRERCGKRAGEEEEMREERVVGRGNEGRGEMWVRNRRRGERCGKRRR